MGQRVDDDKAGVGRRYGSEGLAGCSGCSDSKEG